MRIAFLVLLLALVACSGSLNHDQEVGRTYYVSPTGDDENPGTREMPWRNPGRASRRIRGGDALVLMEGVYVLSEYDSDILSPPSGREDSWTVIKGEDGKRVVLAGSKNLLTAIDLSGREYVRVENLEITALEGEEFRDGIEILNSPASHIELSNLYIHHLDEFGVNVQDVYDLEIVGCTITYTGFGAVGGPRGESGGWRKVLIERCDLSYSGHYYQGGDTSIYDRPDGIGIEPSEGPVEISHTTVRHNRGDGIDSKARSTYIHHCVVSNNFADGIKLWGGNSRVENTLVYGRGDGSFQETPWSAIVVDAGENSGASFTFFNVTVDDEVGRNYLMHVQYDHRDFPVVLVMKNVIFSSRGENAPVFVNGPSTVVMEHDLFYFPRSPYVLVKGDRVYTEKDLGDLGEGNLYGDPLFVKVGYDYHLVEESPAVDSGTSVGAPSDDLDGVERPLGGGYDIGAYER